MVRWAHRMSAAAALGLGACLGDDPTGVVLVNPMRALSTGLLHTCAADAQSRVVCWGSNELGQLGDGTTVDRSVPGLVSPPLSAASVSVGGGHSCAVTATGGAHCWGFNLNGQLGVAGGDVCVSGPCWRTPREVAAGLSFSRLVAGGSFTCGVSRGGLVHCWGWNAFAQLGDGSRVDREAPEQVIGISDMMLLSAGRSHACAVDASGDAYCWGDNSNGQLGDGSRQDSSVPVALSGGLTFTAIGVGFDHSCAVTDAGDAVCWGSNVTGQLGDSAVASSLAPRPIAGGRRFTTLAAGASFTCAIEVDGRAFCWGANASGQLGAASSDICVVGSGQSQLCAITPQAVSGGLTFAEISAGVQHTCGISTDGIAYCWGANEAGQLGTSAGAGSVTPIRVDGQSSPDA